MKLTLKEQNQKLLEDSYKEACQNQEFVKIINKLKLTKEEALKITSKIIDTSEELANCRKCQGLSMCKNKYLGHISTPIKDKKIYFTYLPCKYYKERIKQINIKNELSHVNDVARMKDIDYTDKKRIKVIKWLDDFFSNYSLEKPKKGLYLYGNFGCGKTFLISALLNELKASKQLRTEIVYYPELLRSLKNDWELYENKIKLYEEVDILCFDDIGAEKVTDWSRDEVLGTILQTRMNNNKTTFFTSNLSIEELESHFKTNNSVEETLKSRRIIERIKQLSIPMDLISENRRT